MTADGLVVEANAPYIEISNTGENAGGIKMYDSGGAATQYFNLTYDSGSTNTVGFDSGASGEYTFSVNTAEKMRISATGNVGLGVVPESWHSTAYALQLGPDTALYDDGGYTILSNNMYSNASNKYISTDEASRYTKQMDTYIPSSPKRFSRRSDKLDYCYDD